jgi:hypothetical protein
MGSPSPYQGTDFRTPKRMTRARASASSTAQVSRERAAKEERREVAGMEVSLEIKMEAEA